MKIATWNINSVRLRKELVLRFLQESGADILCLQETKTIDDFFPKEFFEHAGYPHLAFRGMKSYNGVAVISKHPFLSVEHHNFCQKSDCRHIAVSIQHGIEIHNCYVPAGGDLPDPERNDKFAHKLDFVDEISTFFSKHRDKKAKMILLGDFNIAPDPMDVWSHRQLLNVVSHTPIEVEKLQNSQSTMDWIDAARHFIPPPEKLYSWWSYRARDWRKSDRGRRLDHIWVTPSLKNALIALSIFKDVRDWKQPSDHVPIMLEINPAAS